MLECILHIDFEKAFDSLSWSYIKNCLHFFFVLAHWYRSASGHFTMTLHPMLQLNCNTLAGLESEEVFDKVIHAL
jgi:hypothetical protein